MLSSLRNYIGEHRLLSAGERLGVAVSGGADSVGLLRAMLELRSELGVVLSVVHLHHGIRGASADADAEFVGQLAAAHGLEFRFQQEDAPAYAAEHRLSLEAAGRALRYHFFEQLVSAGKLDKVATAHNADDQAETVLLRLLRGAWTRGLGGIYPSVREGRVIRPLLGTSRSTIVHYLNTIGQCWREDQSNTDRDFLRNRVRHELLPLLERDYNPGVRNALNNLSALARSDHEYWVEVTQKTLTALTRQVAGRPALGLSALFTLPIALQRRVLMAEARQQLKSPLQFDEVESLLRLAHPDAPKRVQLRGGTAEVVRREGGRLLIFRSSSEAAAATQSYEYHLRIPGEVRIPELRAVVRARLVTAAAEAEAYNPATLLNPETVGAELVLRNWRAGDRFRPLRSRSEQKVKRLLQEKKVVHPEKALWPVAVSGDRIVWVRGLAVASEFAHSGAKGQALVIEFDEQS